VRFVNRRNWIGVLAIAAVAFTGLSAWQWQASSCDDLSDREITDRFTVLWGHASDTWRKNSFLGIRTLQNPLDVWITFEIIHKVKPDVIVETGTHHGGSAALWAMFLEHVNPEGCVITIDIENESAEARALPISRRRVDYLIGSSTDPEIVEEVRRRVAGKSVLVILDSAHYMDHVLHELRAYAPMVPRGSYIIVQDTAMNGNPTAPGYGPGPYEAVEAFLAENKDFVADRSRERLMMTNSPRGFLRRIR
jgi:cephalosporin hydroxylase